MRASDDSSLSASYRTAYEPLLRRSTTAACHSSAPSHLISTRLPTSASPCGGAADCAGRFRLAAAGAAAAAGAGAGATVRDDERRGGSGGSALTPRAFELGGIAAAARA